MKKRTFAIMVAALVALSIIAASPASASFSPIYMPDGTQRNDVELAWDAATDELWVSNLGRSSVIRVEYTDPVYGQQVVVLSPTATSLGTARLCADNTVRYTVTVTFDPGTSSEKTGYGNCGTIFGSGDENVAYITGQYDKTRQALLKAKAVLAKARKALAKAKRQHRSAWVIRKAKRQVYVARVKVKKARYNFEIAADDMRTLQEGMRYCAERRVG